MKQNFKLQVNGVAAAVLGFSTAYVALIWFSRSMLTVQLIWAYFIYLPGYAIIGLASNYTGFLFSSRGVWTVRLTNFFVSALTPVFSTLVAGTVIYSLNAFEAWQIVFIEFICILLAGIFLLILGNLLIQLSTKLAKRF